jgi:hypothetical protein
MFLQDLEAAGEQPRPQVDWIEQLSHHEDPDRRRHATTIRKIQTVVKGTRPGPTDRGVKIWSGPSADKQRPGPRIQLQADMSHLEKDFTTAGTPSKLGCPFTSGSAGRQSPLITPRSSTSRMSLGGRRSKRPSFNDPIRAEFCGNDQVSASVSIEGSAAVCPIRFLDQHAPEDVAKYFENHKHEIPRSHEVCIKRFQDNTESIQELDRKYGNLVSMIQGLGQKHQEYLPLEPEEDEAEPETKAKYEERVQKWTNGVTSSLKNEVPEDAETQDNGLDEATTAHFDRPLKEVRVGESADHPWGITIPTKYTDAGSSSSVGSIPTASPPLPLDTSRPIGATPQKAAKCPFDHRALGKTPEVRAVSDIGKAALSSAPSSAPQPERPSPQASSAAPSANNERKQSTETAPAPKIVPQMVFNGPVFFGYPPDQLMALLQNSNLGGMTR